MHSELVVQNTGYGYGQLAYEMALLSPQEAFEYKWNISVNLQGGIGQNIPNDDLCELQVRRIKKTLLTQGPNKSFESAQVITQTSQVIDDMVLELQKQSQAHRSGRGRSKPDKSSDVYKLAKELKAADVLNHNTSFPTFSNFKDPVERIKISKLCEWVSAKQKEAKLYLSK